MAKLSKNKLHCLRVLRAFEVLEVFSDGDTGGGVAGGGVAITTIATFTQLSRSTVQRHMTALLALGLVDANYRTYRRSFARRYYLTAKGHSLVIISE